jgi:hypothetical protein
MKVGNTSCYLFKWKIDAEYIWGSAHSGPGNAAVDDTGRGLNPGDCTLSGFISKLEKCY